MNDPYEIEPRWFARHVEWCNRPTVMAATHVLYGVLAGWMLSLAVVHGGALWRVPMALVIAAIMFARIRADIVEHRIARALADDLLKRQTPNEVRDLMLRAIEDEHRRVEERRGHDPNR